MIDIYNGELKDLWPEEKSPEFLAVSYAIKLRIAKIIAHAAKIGVRYDIDGLDEEVLDYLAIELRAQYYDQSLDIEVKREIIKKALLWRARAGTTSATKELINTVLGPSEVVEWYDNGMNPYEFEIKTRARMTPTFLDDLMELMRRAKNVRSHLGRLTAVRHADKQIYVGATFFEHKHYVNNKMPTVIATASMPTYIGTAMFANKRYIINRMPTIQSEASTTGYIGTSRFAFSHYIANKPMPVTGTASGSGHVGTALISKRHYIISNSAHSTVSVRKEQQFAGIAESTKHYVVKGGSNG